METRVPIRAPSHLSTGEKGILRYRGIPIEDLAEQSTFIETALLLIYRKLPTDAELQHFSQQLTKHELIHEEIN